MYFFEHFQLVDDQIYQNIFHKRIEDKIDLD